MGKVGWGGVERMRECINYFGSFLYKVPETSESQVQVNEALGAYSVENSVEDSEMRMTAEPIEEQ